MSNSFLSQEEIEALLRDTPPGEQPGSEASRGESSQPADTDEVRAPGLLSGSDSIGFNSQNLNLILDIPLKLTVLLGRTKRPISDVLKLAKGSIVELDRLENEPVDILVNDTLIARGEVVVVREYFGVRITDIISTEKRIRSLVSS